MMNNENLTTKMVLDAFCKAAFPWLNSEEGQKVVAAYRVECLKNNPNMTPAEWQDEKSELLGNMFYRACTLNEGLMKSLQDAVWNELKQKEAQERE